MLRQEGQNSRSSLVTRCIWSQPEMHEALWKKKKKTCRIEKNLCHQIHFCWLGFIVNLTQPTITWQENLKEKLSRSGCPVHRPEENCLNWWSIEEDPAHCGQYHSLGWGHKLYRTGEMKIKSEGPSRQAAWVHSSICVPDCSNDTTGCLSSRSDLPSVQTVSVSAIVRQIKPFFLSVAFCWGICHNNRN